MFSISQTNTDLNMDFYISISDLITSAKKKGNKAIREFIVSFLEDLDYVFFKNQS